LRAVAEQWTEVTANDQVREHAIRLLRVHNLRAADAVQLSAALMASGFEPRTFDFVTLDSRQALAADREGFNVLPPASLSPDKPTNG
jgi:predicted nucleic acid-binding protein